MKIYWGFRFALDSAFFYLMFQMFSNYPVLYYRFAKSEPIRWTQRRRAYFNNQYISDKSQWKLNYNDRMEAITQF
jgi:hypothetical protein